MAANDLRNAPTSFWQKYEPQILTLILTVYILPVGFYHTIYAGWDDSWARALNLAIKNNITFGKDVVFTYGPFAYLSTRNTEYIHTAYLFFADIFLCTCFYHITYDFLSKYKGWFLILLLSVLYLKGAEFSSYLFLFFITFVILNFQKKFANKFEIICCAICGVVLFFVKINYGLVAIPVLIFTLLFTYFKNRNAFWLFLATVAIVFSIIYLKTNVNIVYYIKYSLPLISCYNEAMQIENEPAGTLFISAMLLFAIFAVTALVYLYQRRKTMQATNIFIVILLSIQMFLIYKNAFTRADQHVYLFFYIYPFFLVFTLLLLGFGRSALAKTICVIAILLSDLNVALPYTDGNKGIITQAAITNTYSYFKNLMKTQPEMSELKVLKLPADKLKIIGNSTIDILPLDISIIDLNNLNYCPRPIVQSYSAYSPLLDSLNAHHFYKEGRPTYIMTREASIDRRYSCWDESITNATIHLNYDYVDSIKFGKDAGIVNSDGFFLLLKSKKVAASYPMFEKINERVVNFEDTVHIDFPEGSPVYMTADIEYTVAGRISSIVYQAPFTSVSIFLDSACMSSFSCSAIRPMLKAPVLISNIITDNTQLGNFITGGIGKNPKIKAFAFHDKNKECQQQIRLTFFKFSNY